MDQTLNTNLKGLPRPTNTGTIAIVYVLYHLPVVLYEGRVDHGSLLDIFSS